MEFLQEFIVLIVMAICYLYDPYSQLGGNGSAKKIIEEVNKLPIRKVDVRDIVEDARP